MHPQPLVKEVKYLALYKHSSVTPKTLVCDQHYCHPKSTAQHNAATMKKVNSILADISTGCHLACPQKQLDVADQIRDSVNIEMKTLAPCFDGIKHSCCVNGYKAQQITIKIIIIICVRLQVLIGHPQHGKWWVKQKCVPPPTQFQLSPSCLPQMLVVASTPEIALLSLSGRRADTPDKL